MVNVGAATIKWKINHWSSGFFKITAYAEELLDFTDKLPGWPERVLSMQRNWIGKSIGAEIDFKVDGSDEIIKVFTTRPRHPFWSYICLSRP